MIKAARFDGDTFLELRNDNGATGQAVAVLFLASLSYGVGYTFYLELQAGTLALDVIVVGIFTRLLLSLLASLVWAFTAFLVGTKLFRGKTLFWEMARPLFFSATPGLFFILLVIPVQIITLIIASVLLFWILIAGMVAVKNAMGFSYTRSMLTYIVGFLALVAIGGFLGL